jgi:Uri superfamily endonuclease
MKGTYLLIIFLPIASKIKIGALGDKFFKQGFYLYVGSAMGNIGSSTILNRVKRHLSTSNSKKKHWHIDYLLESKNAIITKLILIPSLEKLECIIAQELMESSNGTIKHFGSSDCKCKSHLFYFEKHERIPFR